MKLLIKIVSFALVLTFCASSSEEEKKDRQLVAYKCPMPRNISDPKDNTLMYLLYHSLELFKKFERDSEGCFFHSFFEKRSSFDLLNIERNLLPGWLIEISFEKSPSNKSLEEKGLVSLEGSKKGEMILYNKNWETEDKLTLEFKKEDETGRYECQLIINLIESREPFNYEQFKKMIKN